MVAAERHCPYAELSRLRLVKPPPSRRRFAGEDLRQRGIVPAPTPRRRWSKDCRRGQIMIARGIPSLRRLGFLKVSTALARARAVASVPRIGRRRSMEGLGRVSCSIRAEEGAVDGRFDCYPSMQLANSLWAVVGRRKGEEAPR